MRYGSKWPEYAQQWDRMQINPNRVTQFTKEAQFALNHKAQYLEIEGKTGVPWYMVAALHRRESDANFNTYLGNGDPLNHRTTHVPKGRGPFPTFVAGAVDALKLDGLSSVIDWRLEKILYYCEIYNGTGYNSHGVPSPYLWGGTNIQRPGKYVADGVWDSHATDSQPGCAPLILSIARLDPSIHFIRET